MIAVSGFSGYFVTEDGRVWSVRKCGNGCDTFSPNPHELRQSPAGRGYMKVALSINGIARTKFVHQLILEAFCGPRPLGHEACHRDGNKRNNSLSNLYWGTKAQNAADSIRLDATTKGTRNGMAKLSESQIREIKACAGAVSQKKIAERFGVSQSNVSMIVTGRYWSHVS